MMQHAQKKIKTKRIKEKIKKEKMKCSISFGFGLWSMFQTPLFESFTSCFFFRL
jgi:hypothetical protein